jgi:hypothetical protein
MIVHLQYISMSDPKISCHISGEGIELIYVRFVADIVTLGEIFLTVFRLPSTSNLPPMRHTHLRLNTTVSR